uniref:Uncharacterized protein n=1 Tax=Setaria viridis TaxID=4556 RepID=A0A4U6WEW2_SETVI|nr:hypothetical protein SEVIR_1G193250v2 [Setaria viridis]
MQLIFLLFDLGCVCRTRVMLLCNPLRQMDLVWSPNNSASSAGICLGCLG